MGFKEAFTRGQEEEKNLLFDDDAFYYFAISIITIIVIPLGYSVLKPLVVNVLFGGNNKVFKRVQQGANDKKVLEKVRQEQRTKWLNASYYLKVFILVVLLTFLWQSYTALPNHETIKGFDPYEILEIDPTASAQQIKSAFRKMSVKLHPDKNPDDPQAAQKFIMLTKAYECLTDETMREICSKYGNPDGRQAFQVGIALPSFLLTKENRAAFLAVIFLILLVIVPVIVLNALGSIGKLDDNGVQRQNYEVYEKFLNENFIFRNCPKLYASTVEFSTLQVTSRQEEEFLNRMMKDLIEEAEIRKISGFDLAEIIEQRKKKKDKRQFMISKAFILIYAHLFQKKIDSCSKAHYDYIVKMIPKITQSMIQYALQFSNRFNVERLRRMGRIFTKFMGLRCIQILLEFSQMTVQGLWERDPDIYQVEFFRKEASKYQKKEKLPDFTELVNKPKEQRHLPQWIPEEKREEILNEIDLFPRIKVTTNLKIEDETVEEMTTDDFLILSISLTRENTPEGQEIPFAHSNAFTYIKEEVWHIFLSINEEVFFYKKLNGNQRTQTAEWKFVPKMVFGETTDLKFHLTVKSDCYKGLDQETPLQYKIKHIKEVNRVVTYHKEDQDLDKELPFINRMLNPMAQQEINDSDDESEEEEKTNAKDGKVKQE